MTTQQTELLNYVRTPGGLANGRRIFHGRDVPLIVMRVLEGAARTPDALHESISKILERGLCAGEVDKEARKACAVILRPV
jgi:hypothetical protein